MILGGVTIFLCRLFQQLSIFHKEHNLTWDGKQADWLLFSQLAKIETFSPL
jgi:hypothetical protein